MYVIGSSSRAEGYKCGQAHKFLSCDLMMRDTKVYNAYFVILMINMNIVAQDH